MLNKIEKLVKMLKDKISKLSIKKRLIENPILSSLFTCIGLNILLLQYISCQVTLTRTLESMNLLIFQTNFQIILGICLGILLIISSIYKQWDLVEIIEGILIVFLLTEIFTYILELLNYVLKNYYPVFIEVNTVPYIPKFYFFNYYLTAGMKLGFIRLYYHNYTVVEELVKGWRILNYSVIIVISIFILLVYIFIESERNLLKKAVVQTIFRLVLIYVVMCLSINVIGMITLTYELIPHYVLFVKIFVLCIDCITIINVVKYLYKLSRKFTCKK